MLSVEDVTPAVGQIVHFDASASVPHDQGNGRIVSYEFDFGDGSHTREQSSPFASHAYSLVGPKRATVQVEDARGNEDSASVRIDVQPKSPPTGTPDLTPASASTIPAQPIEGQIAIVSITIAHRGNATAEAATIPTRRVERESVSLSIKVVNRSSVAADAAIIEISDVRPNGTIVPLGTSVLSTPLGPGDFVVVDSPSFVAVGVGDHQLQIDIR